MLKPHHLITALAFALLSSPALTQPCLPGNEKFRVVFGNGVWVTPEGAQRSKEELQAALGDTLAGQAIVYDIAYNQTNTLAVDLAQAALQQGIENFRELMMALDGYGALPDWAVSAIERSLSTTHEVIASDVQLHVEKYREAILQGQKVLVVAHSQGNFYANEAYHQLATAQPRVPLGSFGILGVATPASYVAGGGQYLTHDGDIIRWVPGSLPQNWTLQRVSSNSGEDEPSQLQGHSFVETYLSSEYNVRAELVRRARNSMSHLVDPPPVFGSGPVTVTMVWNLNASDVDLHVFEPSGAHVFYASTAGFSGFLDRDDIAGYGPEHYYTDCSQLQVGEYVVGLNYFDDHDATLYSFPVRPATAAVTISVPGATRTFYRRLEQHWGEAGDESPVGVARIKISETPAPAGQIGPLQYSIESL